MGQVLRPQWVTILVGVIVGLGWTAAKVAIPLLVKGAIDNGIEANDSRALARWAIAIYAHCQATGEWPGYGDGVHHISLPGWARAQEEEILS